MHLLARERAHWLLQLKSFLHHTSGLRKGSCSRRLHSSKLRIIMKYRRTRRVASPFLAASVLAFVPLVLGAADLEVRLQPSRSNTGKVSYDNLQVVFLEDGAPTPKLIVN